MDECKPLLAGSTFIDCVGKDSGAVHSSGRGLHSSTFRLNLSRFCH